MLLCFGYIKLYFNCINSYYPDFQLVRVMPYLFFQGRGIAAPTNGQERKIYSLSEVSFEPQNHTQLLSSSSYLNEKS